MKNSDNDDWLRVDYYAKLPAKRNPYNIGCTLCFKTHLVENCPNRKPREKTSEETKDKSMYDYSEDDMYNNPNNYGW